MIQTTLLLQRLKINVYQNFTDFKKKNKKKLDYAMCAITGLDGLESTLEIIQSTRRIAIANKAELIAPAFPIANVATGTPAGI